MAHEIQKHDGVMLGSGQAAWHGLGTVVAEAQSAEEAIKLALLDWQVDLEPLYLDANGGRLIVPGWFATCRQDLDITNPARILGCVKSAYRPIQNVESFAIADALLGQGVKFETAGSIRNGKITWMLARCPENIIVKDDKLGKYLLITNAHDGSRAQMMLFTSIRVVCSNTLHAALQAVKNMAKIRHSKNAAAQVVEARRILGLADTYFNKFAVIAHQLADHKVGTELEKGYVEDLWPTTTASKAANTQNLRTQDKARGLFHGGQMGGEQDAVRGSAWGLLNAVTELVDHAEIKQAKERDPREVAFERIMIGSAASFKERAFKTMLRRVGIQGADEMETQLVTASLN